MVVSVMFYFSSDIDECAENTFECATNAQCINLPGTYMCTCNEGYYGDGKVCIRIGKLTTTTMTMT